MPLSFTNLISLWLLSLVTSATVTAGQNGSFTSSTASEETTEMVRYSQKMEAQSLRLDVGSLGAASTIVPVNPATDKTSRMSSLQTTQTAAFPPNAISSMASTTEAISTAIKSTIAVESRQTSNPTKPPTSVLSSSTQSQSTRNILYIYQISIHPATHSRPSTNLISTETTSPKTDGGEVAHSTSMGKTSLTTQAKNIQESSEKKGSNHGKVVAGLIAGALVVMMAGFLLIFIKKQKLQKQQITTTDWAGPSPFLEGGGDSGQVTLRSSNGISLSSFLSQRLSKRLSLLPQTDQELDDLNSGTTFGGKHQENSTFCPEADEKENDVTAAVDPEKKNTGYVAETLENSEMSSQSNNSLFTKNNGEVSNVNQDNSEPPLNLSGTVENASTQNNEGLGQP